MKPADVSADDSPHRGTYASWRFRVDVGNLLRGSAAFADAWRKNKEEFIRGPSQAFAVEAKMDGLVVAAAIDSFSVYISELLILTFSQMPQMIESKMIDQRKLWSGASLDDLRWQAINEVVRDLSYKGFRNLDDHLKKRFNFALATSRLTRARMSYLYEIRNSVVHNRGVFSWISDDRMSANGRITDKIAYYGRVTPVVAYVLTRMEDIDARAIEKFSLNAVTFRECFLATSSKAKKNA